MAESTGKNPRLSETTDIELVDEDFATESRRQAAEDIDRFYHEEGIRTFTEMEEVGEWSRSLYQQVYHDHFRAITDEPSETPGSMPRAARQTNKSPRTAWRTPLLRSHQPPSRIRG